MTPRYAPLRPLALAAGSGAGALVAMALLYAPMAFTTLGMHGYGMMGRTGYMMGGSIVFACIWAAIVSAIAGAVVAVIYNALLPKS